ncbi:MAG: GtrA family protein [Firmicutes bacterium]|nr:GtrA family protein [Bacillota bacterium]
MVKLIKTLIRKYETQIRYLIAGGWNTLFGYLSFTGLYFLLNNRLHYLLLPVINYFISVTNAFLCYKFFVFKTKGNYLQEYLRFYLVYGVAFLINMGLLPLFVEVFKIRLLIAQAVIIIFTIAISYVGHKYFSFRNKSVG